MKLARSGWPIVSSSSQGNLQASSSPPNANTLPVLTPKVLLSIHLTAVNTRYPTPLNCIIYRPHSTLTAESSCARASLSTCALTASSPRAVSRPGPPKESKHHPHHELHQSPRFSRSPLEGSPFAANYHLCFASASPPLRFCFASLSSSSKPTSPKFAHPHTVGRRSHNTDRCL